MAKTVSMDGSTTSSISERKKQQQQAFLKWENQSKPQPTKAQLDEIAEQLFPSWEVNRKNEYPTLQECIHALLDGGDTLTELQEKRTAIKNKYPKE